MCSSDLSEEQRKFRERVEWAGGVVFGNERKRRPILLSEDFLDRFSLGQPVISPLGETELDRPPNFHGLQRPPSKYRPNSHLSLLAMVDCWAHLSINPYTHLSLAATPPFRLFLGVAEHLFLSPTLLSASIHSALFDTWHRSNDLEFVCATRGWSQCVSFESFTVYRKRFDETRAFFDGRFEEAGKLGAEMIQAVMESEVEREEEESLEK